MSDLEDLAIPSARVTHEGPESYDNVWQKVTSNGDPSSLPSPSTFALTLALKLASAFALALRPSLSFPPSTLHVWWPVTS